MMPSCRSRPRRRRGTSPPANVVRGRRFADAALAQQPPLFHLLPEDVIGGGVAVYLIVPRFDVGFVPHLAFLLLGLQAGGSGGGGGTWTTATTAAAAVAAVEAETATQVVVVASLRTTTPPMATPPMGGRRPSTDAGGGARRGGAWRTPPSRGSSQGAQS